ncbi:uncharacterized protein N7496_002812 [Penicillium cataractarum]|uniref:Uncharacterized protein n=1 Tax=Penicillium cataractarum TaxID=2100454 RepID=A0A9W9SMH6_9EURO|nr:uncharacterized protein N7496_002812 [Penicillium cataractarum]KAJ5380384.1 hypothetical protein N7496_002812 [Penicillium cataractarum]
MLQRVPFPEALRVPAVYLKSEAWIYTSSGSPSYVSSMRNALHNGDKKDNPTLVTKALVIFGPSSIEYDMLSALEHISNMQEVKF